MSSGLIFCVGTAVISVVFALAWLLARHVNNYSLVDPVWAFGIGLAAIFWFLSGVIHLKQIVGFAMIMFWSVRLVWHLQSRIRKHHPQEDPRYDKLRKHWKGKVASSFFWFFQAQALSVLLLSLPFWFVSRDDGSDWGSWEYLGMIVSIIGIGGESLADRQMKRFKFRNSDAKGVCQEGLWRYSRHPNYFFEGIIWIGFYLFACGSEWGWLTFHAPAIMIFLLLRVTGIPPTEAAAVLRKGKAYREYQRTTSAFIPWLPRK